MKKFLLLFFGILFFDASSQDLQTVNGVHTLFFDLEQGGMYLYFPENIVADNSFSGSVAIYPSGNSKHEQAKNLAKLKTYTIRVNNKEFSASGRIFSLLGAANSMNVSLANSKGKILGKKQIPFTLRTALSLETPVSLPSHIANSVNTSFYGRFDGNLENTAVKANGKSLNVVAESPVQIGMRPEELSATSSKIVITDGDTNYQGQCHSIYYTLKIGPTNLRRGQSTFFDATIHGVGSIDKPLTYTVVNGTPSVVTLKGGNSQNFTINPGDGQNGNWFHHFDIKSLRAGSFSLTTNLIVPDTPYPATTLTNEGIVTNEFTSSTQENIDCRIYNQSFNITEEECAALGGSVHNGDYEPTIDAADTTSQMSVVDVRTVNDSNEVSLEIDIQSGDQPEMVVSTYKPLNPEVQSAIQFLTSSEQNYTFSQKNPSFGSPSAGTIETSLLYSDGSSQVITTEVSFSGNPFYSIAKSPELTKIRGEQQRAKSDLNTAQGNKTRLERQRSTTRDRYIKARDDYRKNNSQFWYLWRIDQSLEKAKPVFADSLTVLLDSLKVFKQRTGGAPSKADAKKIEDNLRDAKKAHQDCIDQLGKLKQEQTDLTNEKETLKEQQKQLHRDIMDQFRSTGMNFAGSTRRDKNGKFHYQYGVVTVSSGGTATYHKGSLPAQILSKVSALEKQMKLTTDRLNAVSERLKNLPSEINAKNDACDDLAQKVKDAESAKKKSDAITAEDQYWNNKIEAICTKIKALLNRLKIWAAVNDATLLTNINNVTCGEGIWVQIDRVINRKKVLEKGYEGKAANAKRNMDNAKSALDEQDRKIREEAEKIRNAQKALIESQKAEAIAAAEALKKDQEKCLEIMKKLGYGATSVADVIDLYEISQDLKKAADEAKDAMDNLRKAVEFGEKHGMDSGDAKKWVKKTQERLGNISKKLAKLEKYKDLADKVKEYADRIGTLVGSDGSPTQNAEAFGEGLKFMNEALDAIADKFPILQVFTAYFTFITESYGAIMKGANDAVRKQYQQLLKDVRRRMNCDNLMRVCRNNGDDLDKIKEWAYNEYVVKPGFDALRRDQTQAKAIISKLVEQRMAECCFQRLQAIRAAQQ